MPCALRETQSNSFMANNALGVHHVIEPGCCRVTEGSCSGLGGILEHGIQNWVLVRLGGFS